MVELWVPDYAPGPPTSPWEPSVNEGPDGPNYSTEYVNAMVVAESEKGQILAFTVGRHGLFFPHFDKKSSWDSILLAADDLRLSAEAVKMSGLAIELDEEHDRVRLYVDTELSSEDGEDVAVFLDLYLIGDYHEAKSLKVNIPSTPGGSAVGLLHRPVFLSVAPSPSSTIGIGGGPLLQVSKLAGELEVGQLNWVKDSDLAFRYDYLCIASAEKGYAYVRLEGHALHPDTPAGEVLEGIVGPNMKRQFTLQAGKLNEGNQLGIPGGFLTTGGETSLKHVENVILGLVEQRLLLFDEEDWGPAWGVRQLMTAQ